MSAPFIDHAAVQVSDFDWCLDFFTSVLGMEITLVDPASKEEPWKQVWVGGIQLQRMESAAGCADGIQGCPGSAQNRAEGGPVAGTSWSETASVPGMTHVGIAADDTEAILDKVYAIDGIRQAPGKPRNWFILPDGIMIELVARNQ